MAVSTRLNVTLRQLKVFETVARQLSFTRAARELHLTQPAVSMQVKQLEGVVGLALLEQRGRTIHLTEAGAELQRCSRLIAAQLTETEQLVDELKRLRRGQLSLAVTSTVNYFATRLLGDFSNQYPGVTIRLEVSNREVLLERLALNEPDLALMGQPPEGADLVAETFMANPLVIIAPPDHPLRARRSIPLHGLAAETFLIREEGSGTRLAMERVFAEHGVTITSSMVMNSNEALKQSVQAGLGLGFVSLHTVRQELAIGRLAVLKVKSFPVVRRWFVVHRRDRTLSKVALAFRAFVLSESQRLAPLQAGDKS